MGAISRLYIAYKARIMPKLSGIKGAHWLNRNLLRLVQLEFEKPKADPTNIFDKKWDNLILLDAARHDIYDQIRDKDVDSIVSVGSHSREFVEKTFSKEKEFGDLVYISANPHISELKFNSILDKSLKDYFEVVFETYRKSNSVATPQMVKEDALAAQKLYPNHKKIVHFMQPHAPFIGSKKDLDYRQYKYGEDNKEEIEKAYEENMEFVLESALELAESLDGKTVITADHGELLGENGLYKHLYGLECEALRRVPWDPVD